LIHIREVTNFPKEEDKKDSDPIKRSSALSLQKRGGKESFKTSPALRRKKKGSSRRERRGNGKRYESSREGWGESRYQFPDYASAPTPTSTSAKRKGDKRKEELSA